MFGIQRSILEGPGGPARSKPDTRGGSGVDILLTALLAVLALSDRGRRNCRNRVHLPAA